MQYKLTFIRKGWCKVSPSLLMARRPLTPSRALSSRAMTGPGGLLWGYSGFLGNPCRMLSTVAAPTSRKRRKKAQQALEEEAQPTSVTNFTAEAEKLLSDIHGALLPFEAPTHTGFKMTTKTREGVTSGFEEVTLSCGKDQGMFSFKVDAVQQVINASTPINGGLQYYFDGEAWLNVHDDHDIRGIIVRDMLKITSSAPKL
jgi:hypothetical protein